MTSKDYFDSMKVKLSANYDVYDNYILQNFSTNLYAHFYARNEKYFASKSATIYAYESNEHTFFKYFQTVSQNDLNTFVDQLKYAINHLVDPHDEHMSTRLNAVFVSDGPISPNLKKSIENFKYQKTFLFGLKGWVDLCVIFVNLNTNDVIASKKARKTAMYFSPKPLQ